MGVRDDCPEYGLAYKLWVSFIVADDHRDRQWNPSQPHHMHILTLRCRIDPTIRRARQDTFRLKNKHTNKPNVPLSNIS